MDIDYQAAKDFEDWMIKEEKRMKNNQVEIITPVEKPGLRLPMFKKRPKIDRQLRLF